MFRLKTTTYDLTTGVGKVSIESEISNESDSSTHDDDGEHGSSGHQKASHDYESNIWERIVENIESMLSDEGRVVATESAGNVSVTDTPSIHAEVGEYLKQVNDKLARQVAISVKVYSFRSTDTDDFGFSLKAAFEAASGDYSLGAESFTSNITSPSGLFNAAILEGGDEDSRLRKWEGSEAIVRALDEQGDVSLVTSGSGIVMNNQPLPIQNTKRVGYLKRSEISIGETATTAALESGTVSTGFSLNATPHIMNNNEVVLQYNITLSELDDIQEIESGGSKIQTPEVSSRNFMQQVRMKMGETLFLAGFQSDSDQFSENKSAGGLFGWRKSGETVREMLLISITINEVDA